MSLIDTNTVEFTNLPKQLPVKKLGHQYGKIVGYVNLEHFTRLNSVIIKPNVDAPKLHLELDFSLDIHNCILIKGPIEHTVRVTCQRCLEGMNYKISSNIAVALLKKLKDIKNLTDIDSRLDDYEPIELVEFNDNYMVDLYQIIEDEILLSIPTAVKHDSCDKINNI